MTYRFDIQLLCSHELSQGEQDALATAGCVDADLFIPGLRRRLRFTREATSKVEAVAAALSAVRAAGLPCVPPDDLCMRCGGTMTFSFGPPTAGWSCKECDPSVGAISEDQSESLRLKLEE